MCSYWLRAEADAKNGLEGCAGARPLCGVSTCALSVLMSGFCLPVFMVLVVRVCCASDRDEWDVPECPNFLLQGMALAGWRGGYVRTDTG